MNKTLYKACRRLGKEWSTKEEMRNNKTKVNSGNFCSSHYRGSHIVIRLKINKEAIKSIQKLPQLWLKLGAPQQHKLSFYRKHWRFLFSGWWIGNPVGGDGVVGDVLSS